MSSFRLKTKRSPKPQAIAISTQQPCVGRRNFISTLDLLQRSELDIVFAKGVKRHRIGYCFDQSRRCRCSNHIVRSIYPTNFIIQVALEREKKKRKKRKRERKEEKEFIKGRNGYILGRGKGQAKQKTASTVPHSSLTSMLWAKKRL